MPKTGTFAPISCHCYFVIVFNVAFFLIKDCYTFGIKNWPIDSKFILTLWKPCAILSLCGSY